MNVLNPGLTGFVIEIESDKNNTARASFVLRVSLRRLSHDALQSSPGQRISRILQIKGHAPATKAGYLVRRQLAYSQVYIIDSKCHCFRGAT